MFVRDCNTLLIVCHHALRETRQHVDEVDFDLDAPPDMLPFHEAYHPLPEIAQFTVALERQYPDRVRRVGLGHSVEGREMEALHISADLDPDSDGDNGDEEEGEWFEIFKKKGKKKKKRSVRMCL